MLNYYTLLLDPKLKSNIDFNSPKIPNRSAKVLIKELKASLHDMKRFNQENGLENEKDDSEECYKLTPSCCML